MPPEANDGQPNRGDGSRVDAGERECPQCHRHYPGNVWYCPVDGSPLSGVSQQGLVGKVIARRYRLIKLLGQGGMGQVYLVNDLKMGVERALKVVNAHMLHDHAAIDRFRREAWNASRISHPNVVAVYDYDQAPDGTTYLVMEYVKGQPLSKELSSEGAMDTARAVSIAGQVADALSAAEEHGIVHRDLKPDNIMLVRRRGGRDHVKVVDFGIAKAVHENSQHLTAVGLAIGTPAYMSPEQHAADPTLDGRSDIYSLGCILYEMLTGHRLFEGLNRAAIVHRQMSDLPSHPRDRNPNVPGELDALVVQALARRPADRFQTAAEFADALAALRGHVAAPPE